MQVDGARVLVAGGSGFIGANLIARLRQTRARIRATLHERPAIAELTGPDYVTADLTNMDDCRRVVEGIDVVFMCAANTSGAAVIAASPLTHVTPNVVMNAQLLDAAYHAGVKQFVFVSSTVGYPPTGERPVREDEMFAGDPPDVYFAAGWMKRSAEALCRVYAQLPRPMATLVVRASNCYGPYDKFDPRRSHVTAALVRRVVEREQPLVVWGTGDERRDLIYVEDFIDGMLAATAQDAVFFAVNIASGRVVSVRQMLELLLIIDSWTGAEVRFDPTKPATIATRLVDVTLARERLGFAATTTLEAGLRSTLAWYRAHRADWRK